MGLLKLTIEALDGNPITERTGKSTVKGESSRKPINDKNFIVFYSEKDIESPGVSLWVYDLKEEGDTFTFKDHHGRMFKVTYEE